MVHALVLCLAVAGHGALATTSFAGTAQSRQVPVTAQAPPIARRALVPSGAMPNLIGMTLAEAERHAFVRKFGLTLVAESKDAAGRRPGTIVGQSVRPGDTITTKSRVTVYVASEPKRPEEPSGGRGRSGLGAALGAALAEAVQPTVVPNVVGLEEAAAAQVLAKADLKARVRAEQAPANPGLVIRQKPEPRSRVLKGTAVEIVVASRPDAGVGPRETPVGEPVSPPRVPVSTDVVVPSVVGAPRADAEARLAAVGLRADGIEARTDAARPQTVFDQDPPPGRRVARASTVRLSVALPPLVPVPDLSGRTRPAAEALVREQRLTADFDEDAESVAEPGLVTRQVPEAGTQVESGTVVRATIALGVVVPNLLAVPATDARARLSAVNLGIEERTEPSGAVSASTVLRQVPDAGTRVARGSVVAVAIAVQPQVQVPVTPVPVAPADTPALQPPVSTGGATTPVGTRGGAPQGTGTGTRAPTAPAQSAGPVAGPAVPAPPQSRWPLWLVGGALAGLVAYRFFRANNLEPKPPDTEPEPEVRSGEPPPPPLHVEPHIGSIGPRLETGPSLIAFELRLRASADAGHTTTSFDGALIAEERRLYE